jgi:hypothetical protein
MADVETPRRSAFPVHLGVAMRHYDEVARSVGRQLRRAADRQAELVSADTSQVAPATRAAGGDRAVNDATQHGREGRQGDDRAGLTAG